MRRVLFKLTNSCILDYIIERFLQIITQNKKYLRSPTSKMRTSFLILSRILIIQHKVYNCLNINKGTYIV